MQITIATWNIAGGRPIRSDWLFDYADEDVNYFAEKLRSLDADIVCLQETHLNKEQSVASEIANMLGYAIHETEMSPSHVDAHYSLGNAVLYRKEPKNISDFVFPYPTFPLVPSNGKPEVHTNKGFQVLEFEFGAVVNLQMQPLKFLGTAYDSENGLQFAKEMEKLLLSKVSMPALFCGDFNFREPKMLYLELLSGSRDVLPSLPTRPGGKKSDCIFAPSKFFVKDSGVIETRSDHFLCWATLEIT